MELSTEDTKQLWGFLENMNDTFNEYDKSKKLVEIFQECVKLYSKRCALIFQDKHYTYQELDHMSNQVASNLLRNGISSGDVVGIYMEKSDLFIIAMLSILKCNAVYLPLSKVYPIKRLESMLQISNAKVVITEHAEVFIDIKKFSMDELLKDTVDSYKYMKSNDLYESAYILFTSGTTGSPKGIEIRQNSVINLVNSIKDRVLQKKEEKIIGVLSPYVFDVSGAQIYLALLTGNTLDIIPDEVRLSCELLQDYLLSRNFYCMEITPTRLETQLAYCEQVQKCEFPPFLISCGEALPIELCRKYFDLIENENSIVLNCYGPTETCIYSTIFPLDKKSVGKLNKMLIGRPIYNTKTYILDENLELCPVGEKGELYIGGDGLAIGYVNMPELTQKSFIQDPFEKSQKLYKTGDTVQYTNSGDIEYFGRVDDQIKLRGFRIELSDIENVVKRLSGVTMAKVIVARHMEKEILVLYYTDHYHLTYETIYTHFTEQLPYYMIPNYFVPVSDFMYSINGKLDKSKLPDYTKFALQSNTQIDYEEDESANVFLGYCKTILPSKELSLQDKFLISGGDSLNAVMLSASITKQWGVNIGISDILLSTSLGEILKLIKLRIRQEREKEYIPEGGVKEQAVRKEEEVSKEVNVNMMQKIVLEIDRKRLKSGIMDKNCNLVYTVNTDLYIDSIKLQNALRETINRHEMLRTSFVRHGSNYKMKCHDACEDYFRYLKLDISAEEINIKAYISCFNSEELPLFRVTLIEGKEECQILLLDFNHAIFDFYSLHIFINDLFAYYNRIELPPFKYSLYTYLSRNIKENKKDSSIYWCEILRNRSKALGLLADQSIKTVSVKEDEKIDNLSFSLDFSSIEEIRRKCNELEITEFLFLSTVICLWLGIAAKKQDIIIGTNVLGSNRERGMEVSPIGLFTKLVPLRCQIDKTECISDIFIKQKSNLLRMLKYSDLTIDQIYTSMNPKDMMQGDLFHVILNYTTEYEMKIPYDGRSLIVKEISENLEQVPIYLNCISKENELLINITYLPRLYSHSFMNEQMYKLRALCKLVCLYEELSYEELSNR